MFGFKVNEGLKRLVLVGLPSLSAVGDGALNHDRYWFDQIHGFDQEKWKH